MPRRRSLALPRVYRRRESMPSAQQAMITRGRHVKSRLILALAGVCAVALAIALAIAPSASRTQRASAAVHGLGLHGLSKLQKRHLSGFVSLDAGIGVSAKAPAARAGARMSNAGVNLCPRNFGPNVLVNQNCLNISDPDLQGRAQAQNETAIAQNPFNP